MGISIKGVKVDGRLKGRAHPLPAGWKSQALWVVETDDDRYLGMIAVADDVLLVRTGRQGHPFRVRLADVVTVTPAEKHPDVEVLR